MVVPALRRDWGGLRLRYSGGGGDRVVNGPHDHRSRACSRHSSDCGRDGAPSEPQLAILHRQLRTAEAEIEGYAPDAPDDTKDEAAIRMVGYSVRCAGSQSQRKQNAFAMWCKGAAGPLARVLVSSLVGAGQPLPPLSLLRPA